MNPIHIDSAWEYTPIREHLVQDNMPSNTLNPTYNNKPYI